MTERGATGAPARDAKIRHPFNRCNKRLNDIKRLLRNRYGLTLPNTDMGRDYLGVLAHHLVRVGGDPMRRLAKWAETGAPWASAADIAAAVDKAARNMAAHGPECWSDVDLGIRIALTYPERQACAISTIAPCELSDAEFQQRQRDRRRVLNRQRKEKNRRERGAVRRADYERESLEAQRPWLAAGISRRTWFRRHAAKPVAIGDPAGGAVIVPFKPKGSRRAVRKPKERRARPLPGKETAASSPPIAAAAPLLPLPALPQAPPIAAPVSASPTANQHTGAKSKPRERDDAMQEFDFGRRWSEFI